jgi:hypothetical protein
MMRLQRGLFRSDAASAGTGAGGDVSVLGLILGLVFATAAGGAVTGCVKSVVGAGSATPAVETGNAASGLGTLSGEVCESPTVFCDIGGATVCFGAAGDAELSTAA